MEMGDLQGGTCATARSRRSHARPTNGRIRPFLESLLFTAGDVPCSLIAKSQMAALYSAFISSRFADGIDHPAHETVLSEAVPALVVVTNLPGSRFHFARRHPTVRSHPTRSSSLTARDHGSCIQQEGR
jgi:hypothetical protein